MKSKNVDNSLRDVETELDSDDYSDLERDSDIDENDDEISMILHQRRAAALVKTLTTDNNYTEFQNVDPAAIQSWLKESAQKLVDEDKDLDLSEISKEFHSEFGLSELNSNEEFFLKQSYLQSILSKWQEDVEVKIQLMLQNIVQKCTPSKSQRQSGDRQNKITEEIRLLFERFEKVAHFSQIADILHNVRSHTRILAFFKKYIDPYSHLAHIRTDFEMEALSKFQQFFLSAVLTTCEDLSMEIRFLQNLEKFLFSSCGIDIKKFLFAPGPSSSNPVEAKDSLGIFLQQIKSPAYRQKVEAAHSENFEEVPNPQNDKSGESWTTLLQKLEEAAKRLLKSPQDISDEPFQLSPRFREKFQKLVRSCFMPTSYDETCKGVLKISGSAIVLSEEIDKIRQILTRSPFHQITFNASVEFVLDVDVDWNRDEDSNESQSFSGLNIIINTVNLNVANAEKLKKKPEKEKDHQNHFRIINVSGRAGNSSKADKAHRPNSKHGDDGADGADGDAGESGGNVWINCKRLKRTVGLTLKIVSNGGKGGNGQPGGDGRDGRAGENGNEILAQGIKENVKDTKYHSLFSGNGLTIKSFFDDLYPSPNKIVGYFAGSNWSTCGETIKALCKENVTSKRDGEAIYRHDIIHGGAEVYFSAYRPPAYFWTWKPQVYVFLKGPLGTNGEPGGYGGAGGRGGSGGFPGKIELFSGHPQASLMKRKIIVENTLGQSGKGGLDGKSGVKGRDGVQGTDFAYIDYGFATVKKYSGRLERRLADDYPTDRPYAWCFGNDQYASFVSTSQSRPTLQKYEIKQRKSKQNPVREATRKAAILKSELDQTIGESVFSSDESMSTNLDALEQLLAKIQNCLAEKIQSQSQVTTQTEQRVTTAFLVQNPSQIHSSPGKLGSPQQRNDEGQIEMTEIAKEFLISLKEFRRTPLSTYETKRKLLAKSNLENVTILASLLNFHRAIKVYLILLQNQGQGQRSHKSNSKVKSGDTNNDSELKSLLNNLKGLIKKLTTAEAVYDQSKAQDVQSPTFSQDFVVAYGNLISPFFLPLSANFSKLDGILRISGPSIRLSAELQRISSYLKMNQELKKFPVASRHLEEDDQIKNSNSKMSDIYQINFEGILEILLDCNLDYDHVAGKNVLIDTINLVVDPDVTINVSGKSGSSAPSMPPNLSVDKEEVNCNNEPCSHEGDGQDGKDGEAGQSGGHILINAAWIKNLENLRLVSIGGQGGDGQPGQDGKAGKDGKSGDSVFYEALEHLQKHIQDQEDRQSDLGEFRRSRFIFPPRPWTVFTLEERLFPSPALSSHPESTSKDRLEMCKRSLALLATSVPGVENPENQQQQHQEQEQEEKSLEIKNMGTTVKFYEKRNTVGGATVQFSYFRPTIWKKTTSFLNPFTDRMSSQSQAFFLFLGAAGIEGQYGGFGGRGGRGGVGGEAGHIEIQLHDKSMSNFNIQSVKGQNGKSGADGANGQKGRDGLQGTDMAYIDFDDREQIATYSGYLKQNISAERLVGQPSAWCPYKKAFVFVDFVHESRPAIKIYKEDEEPSVRKLLAGDPRSPLPIPESNPEIRLDRQAQNLQEPSEILPPSLDAQFTDFTAQTEKGPDLPPPSLFLNTSEETEFNQNPKESTTQLQKFPSFDITEQEAAMLSSSTSDCANQALVQAQENENKDAVIAVKFSSELERETVVNSYKYEKLQDISQHLISSQVQLNAGTPACLVPDLFHRIFYPEAGQTTSLNCEEETEENSESSALLSAWTAIFGLKNDGKELRVCTSERIQELKDRMVKRLTKIQNKASLAAALTLATTTLTDLNTNTMITSKTERAKNMLKKVGTAVKTRLRSAPVPVPKPKALLSRTEMEILKLFEECVENMNSCKEATEKEEEKDVSKKLETNSQVETIGSTSEIKLEKVTDEEPKDVSTESGKTSTDDKDDVVKYVEFLWTFGPVFIDIQLLACLFEMSVHLYKLNPTGHWPEESVVFEYGQREKREAFRNRKRSFKDMVKYIISAIRMSKLGKNSGQGVTFSLPKKEETDTPIDLDDDDPIHIVYVGASGEYKRLDSYQQRNRVKEGQMYAHIIQNILDDETSHVVMDVGNQKIKIEQVEQFCETIKQRSYFDNVQYFSDPRRKREAGLRKQKLKGEHSDPQQTQPEITEQPNPDQKQQEITEQPNPDQKQPEIKEQPNPDQKQQEITEQPNPDQKQQEITEQPNPDQKQPENKLPKVYTGQSEDPANEEEKFEDSTELNGNNPSEKDDLRGSIIDDITKILKDAINSSTSAQTASASSASSQRIESLLIAIEDVNVLNSLRRRFTTDGVSNLCDPLLILEQIVFLSCENSFLNSASASQFYNLLNWIISAFPQPCWLDELALLQLEKATEGISSKQLNQWRQLLGKIESKEAISVLINKLPSWFSFPWNFGSSSFESSRSNSDKIPSSKKISAINSILEKMGLIKYWTEETMEMLRQQDLFYWVETLDSAVLLSQFTELYQVYKSSDAEEDFQKGSYYVLAIQNFCKNDIEQFLDVLQKKLEISSKQPNPNDESKTSALEEFHQVVKLLSDIYYHKIPLDSRLIQRLRDSSSWKAFWGSLKDFDFSSSSGQRSIKEITKIILQDGNQSLDKEQVLAAQKIVTRLLAIQKSKEDWTNPEEFRKWAASWDKKDVQGALKVINAAVYHCHKFYLREAQKMAICLLATNSTSILTQVSTGEGKSLIVASVAIIKCLQLENCDVITSSNILAQRDAEENSELFGLFGLTVGHNASQEMEKRKEAYAKNIVYGDASDFQRDFLLTKFYGENILGTRTDMSRTNSIIDEVDSLLLDCGNNVLYLSHQPACLDALDPIFITIFQLVVNSMVADRKLPNFERVRRVILEDFWPTLNKSDLDLASFAEETPEERKRSSSKIWEYLVKKKLIDEGSGRIFLQKFKGADCPSLVPPGDTTSNSKRDNVERGVKFLFSKILSQQSQVCLPNYLKPFVELHLDKWIEGAIYALSLTEGVEYLVDSTDKSFRSTDSHPKIIIVNLDTGVDQLTSQWSEGLHQFLQIKHSCRLSPISLKAIFLSNISYFKKYKKVLGLTGTLGSKFEREFLKQTYSADYVTIPQALRQKFIEDLPILCRDVETWANEIIQKVQRVTTKTSDGGQCRSALVICENVKAVEYLEQKFPPHLKCHIYKRSYEKFDLGATSKSELQGGEIILSTNLAGRGTDIRCASKLSTVGGLFVCLTYLPKNTRTEQQAFGRCARKGQEGSGQLIIFEKGVATFNSNNDFQVIKMKRDRDFTEKKRIRELEKYFKDSILQEETLFERFAQLYTSLMANEKLKQLSNEKKEIILGDCLDQWAFVLDKIGIEDLIDNRLDLDSASSKLEPLLNRTSKFIDGEPSEAKNCLEFLQYPNKLINFAKLDIVSTQKDKVTAKDFLNKVLQHEDNFPAAPYFKAFALLKETNVESEEFHSLLRASALLFDKFIKIHQQNLAKVEEITAILHNNNSSTTSSGMKQKRATISPGFREQQENYIQLYSIYNNSIGDIQGHQFVPENLCSSLLSPAMKRSLKHCLRKLDMISEFKVSDHVHDSQLLDLCQDYNIPLKKLKETLQHIDPETGELPTGLELPGKEDFFQELHESNNRRPKNHLPFFTLRSFICLPKMNESSSASQVDQKCEEEVTTKEEIDHLISKKVLSTPIQDYSIFSTALIKEGTTLAQQNVIGRDVYEILKKDDLPRGFNQYPTVTAYNLQPEFKDISLSKNVKVSREDFDFYSLFRKNLNQLMETGRDEQKKFSSELFDFLLDSKVLDKEGRLLTTNIEETIKKSSTNGKEGWGRFTIFKEDIKQTVFCKTSYQFYILLLNEEIQALSEKAKEEPSQDKSQNNTEDPKKNQELKEQTEPQGPPNIQSCFSDIRLLSNPETVLMYDLFDAKIIQGNQIKRFVKIDSSFDKKFRHLLLNYLSSPQSSSTPSDEDPILQKPVNAADYWNKGLLDIGLEILDDAKALVEVVGSGVSKAHRTMIQQAFKFVKWGIAVSAESLKMASPEEIQKFLESPAIKDLVIKTGLTSNAILDILINDEQPQLDSKSDEAVTDEGAFNQLKHLLLTNDMAMNEVKMYIQQCQSSFAHLETPDGSLRPLTELLDTQLAVKGRFQELELLKLNCLDMVITVMEQKWSWKMMVKTTAVLIFGVAQIVAGVFVELYTVGAGTFVASALISEGIGDIMFAMSSYTSGHFSMEDYTKHKMISLALTFITTSIAIYKAGKVAYSTIGNKLFGTTGNLAQKAGSELIQEAGKKAVFKAVGKRIAGKCLQGIAFGLSNNAIAFLVDSYMENFSRIIADTVRAGVSAKVADSKIEGNLQNLYNKLGETETRRIFSVIQNSSTAVSDLEKIVKAVQTLGGAVQRGVLDSISKINEAGGGVSISLITKILKAAFIVTPYLMAIKQIFYLTEDHLKHMESQLEDYYKNSQDIKSGQSEKNPVEGERETKEMAFQKMKQELIAGLDQKLQDEISSAIRQGILTPLLQMLSSHLLEKLGRCIKTGWRNYKSKRLEAQFKQEWNRLKAEEANIHQADISDTCRNERLDNFQEKKMHMLASYQRRCRSETFYADLVEKYGAPFGEVEAQALANATGKIIKVDILDKNGAAGFPEEIRPNNGVQPTGSPIIISLKENHFTSEYSTQTEFSLDLDCFSRAVPGLGTPEQIRQLVADQIRQDPRIIEIIHNGWHQHYYQQGKYGGREISKKSIKGDINEENYVTLIGVSDWYTSNFSKEKYLEADHLIPKSFLNEVTDAALVNIYNEVMKLENPVAVAELDPETRETYKKRIINKMETILIPKDVHQALPAWGNKPGNQTIKDMFKHCQGNLKDAFVKSFTYCIEMYQNATFKEIPLANLCKDGINRCIQQFSGLMDPSTVQGLKNLLNNNRQVYLNAQGTTIDQPDADSVRHRIYKNQKKRGRS